ncbi:glycosyltransferase [Mesorhizobium sp. ANAO-SY3R2]|uniref:glycosyltransferase n=1 Tax=Mesorhizobium sp. ANAO-SY3R2 TaxID=3166644 RepID=UPI00367210D6
MLLEFIAKHYPEILPAYCGYRNGVQRADAARYMLLHHFGGVYADLDCECIAPFGSIMDEDRIVLCEEPDHHAHEQKKVRNLPYLLFNGTMASPPGHPFWQHLIARLPLTRDTRDVLDSTGPFLLTAAQLSFPDQTAFSIHPNPLFSPIDLDGRVAPPEGTHGPTLSIHHWAGTWWSPVKPRPLLSRLRREFYRARHELTKGKQMDVAAAQASVDRAVIDRPPPSGGNIAVLVPLRDAVDHIAPFLAALEALEHPAERIKLVFCEGDSTDGTWDRLNEATAALTHRYRDVVFLRKQLGTHIDREKRSKRALQRVRRAGIAAVRNHLIEHGLDETDDWALWMDIDVWHWPVDIIARMTATGRRIIVPNCTTSPGGDSFDLNSFVSVSKRRDYRYYRAMRNGLHQPPAKDGRLYLSDLRNYEKIELDGVGGAVLLVDAALHRGGRRFPEIPYKFLIETEGFAALAKDLGISPIGLPQVEVHHVPW